MKKSTPNYKRIYGDIIKEKYPDKSEECRYIISKRELSALDILNLNKIIFNRTDESSRTFNQKHNSYDYNAILEILDFQRKNNCTNLYLSKHFNLSRNTITKWKKHFLAK